MNCIASVQIEGSKLLICANQENKDIERHKFLLRVAHDLIFERLDRPIKGQCMHAPMQITVSRMSHELSCSSCEEIDWYRPPLNSTVRV